MQTACKGVSKQKIKKQYKPKKAQALAKKSNKYKNIKRNMKNKTNMPGGANSGQGAVKNKSNRPKAPKAQNIILVLQLPPCAHVFLQICIFHMLAQKQNLIR